MKLLIDMNLAPYLTDIFIVMRKTTVPKLYKEANKWTKNGSSFLMVKI